MNPFGKSGFFIRFDREEADSHSGPQRISSRSQPIPIELLENKGRMIVSQARFRDAGAARAFGAIPHPVARSAGGIGTGQHAAVQAKGRHGDRAQTCRRSDVPT